jgi:putative SOS response-associated peptidase YedK
MYNIAPTDLAPVICLEDEVQTLFNARWGLMPSWAKDSRTTRPYFNARLDNLANNKVYASSSHRRCLVPMAGFYEWPKGNKREPWYFRTSNPLFYAGGLWRDWHDPQDKIIRTFTILTTVPHPVIKPIHNRMPVIIRPEDHEQWLHDDIKPALDLAVTYAGDINAYRVDAESVNNSSNKGQDCIREI